MADVPEVIALFGPTGVGKTARRDRAGHAAARTGRAAGGGLGRRAAGLRRPRDPDRRRDRRRARAAGTSADLVPPVDATFSAGQYAELAHAEIDELLAAGRRPIVVGGTGLYLRAALTELSLRPPPPEGVRERWTAELERHGPAALHATLAARAPWAAAEIEPSDRQRIVRALELLDAGELEPPDGESELWTDAVRRPTLLSGS